MAAWTDSFNRADGALGANWTNYSGDSNATLNIVSNVARAANCYNYTKHFATAAGQFGASYMVGKCGSAGTSFGGIVRGKDTGNFACLTGSVGTSTWSLIAFINGTYTPVASQANVASGTHYRLEANGTTITAYKGNSATGPWTKVVEGSNASIQATGYAGIFCSSGTFVVVDDFECDAIVTTETKPVTDATWIGRWATYNVDGAEARTCIVMGSSFRANFTGTQFGINIHNAVATPTFLAVSVDGGAWSVVSLTSTTVTLATGLTDAAHTIEVVLSGYNGATVDRWAVAEDFLAIKSFVVGVGKAVSAWPLNAPKLFVYGDSIPESDNCHPTEAGWPYAHIGYPWLLARALGYELWPVVYAGNNVTKQGDYTGWGYAPPAHENYPYASAGHAWDDPAGAVVIVAISQNDVNGAQPEFDTHYRDLLDLIVADHPDAELFLLSQLGGWNGTIAAGVKATIQACAAEYGAAYIDPVAWGSGHPNAAGHATIATNLQAYVPAAVAVHGAIADSVAFAEAVAGEGHFPLIDGAIADSVAVSELVDGQEYHEVKDGEVVDAAAFSGAVAVDVIDRYLALTGTMTVTHPLSGSE